MSRSLQISTPGTGYRTGALVLKVCVLTTSWMPFLAFPVSEATLQDLLFASFPFIYLAGFIWCRFEGKRQVKLNNDIELKEGDQLILSDFVKDSPKAINLLRISNRSGKDDSFTYRDIGKMKHRIEALVKKDLLNNSGVLATT